MVKRPRRTQAEEVIRMLKREGFREVSKKEVEKEPDKTIYSLPDCFEDNKKRKSRK